MRVGMIFSGGPAPAANAVISSTATAFLNNGHEVIGIKHGYQYLTDYDSAAPLVEGKQFIEFNFKMLKGLRNDRGIIMGTARANPGKMIKSKADLEDAEKTAPLARTYKALIDLDLDALISIGGDDTLKTANFMVEFQKRLPENAKRIQVVHLPKTIDNDYAGIDFTFGYFSAVDQLAQLVLNLRADAAAQSAYFLVEAMGRKAGWLAYSMALAGEAQLVLSVEDLVGDMVVVEDGVESVNLPALVQRIVDMILAREKTGKKDGVVVIAEGFGERLPKSFIENIGRDEHGHIRLHNVDIGRIVADAVAERYAEVTGKGPKKITPVKLGYEGRCAPPQAYDVVLSAAIGLGAYRALAENKMTAKMVSVSGQFDIQYVPFEDLIDPETMLTTVRFVDPKSDFMAIVRQFVNLSGPNI